MQVDPTQKVGYGYGNELGQWCESGTPFFTPISGTQASTVVTYPASGQILLSGYISGESALRGKSSIVDAPLGAGRVILLAPNVLYRAQTTGTYMFFWNSILEGSRQSLMGYKTYLPAVHNAQGGQ